MRDRAKNQRIGVFLCRCGGNISNTVDIDELKAFALKQPGVVFSEYQSFTCSTEGQGLIQDKVKEENLDAVIIGCCTPKQYEDLYREALSHTPLNPYKLEMVNIREQVSYPHHHEPQKATAKAKKLLIGAINKVKLLEPLEVKKAKVNRDIAVIGGGVAGINASLTLSKLGFKVYLIEKQVTIGGAMAKLVKTFPTDDCAMCTLSPKLDEVGKDNNITLMTYSEVSEVERIPEGYRLRILRHPRYLDEEICTGCGKCNEVCPVEVPNPYDMGLHSTRRAAYKPFPSAIPIAYCIERNGIPPCRAECAIDQAAQGYIALVAKGKFYEAMRVIRRDNALPTVCGRVCMHPCEDACTRCNIDEPIAIAAIKRFVTDYYIENPPSEPLLPKIKKRKEKVAIIGSGPAGLAAAHELAMHGVQVTVYEAKSELGGMLALGIPSYRLPKKYLDYDIDYIRSLGVKFVTNTRIGKDLSLADLRKKHDAVLIAAGLSRSFSIKIPGVDLPEVILGGDMLEQVRLGTPPKLGKRLVVVGGGNVAVDVARTARRLGVEDITMICLETRETMPAIEKEIEEAEKEGIKIRPAISPKAFKEENGKLTGVETIEVERIDFWEDGRLKPIFRENTEDFIPADNIVMAIGQVTDLDFLTNHYKVSNRRLIEIDDECATSVNNVFAAGDVAIGASTVTKAMGSGKKAALNILKSLNIEPRYDPIWVFKEMKRYISAEEVIEARKGYYEKTKRQQMPELEPDKRDGFAEVELGFTSEQAMAEAQRCLNCGGCSDCRECIEVCEKECIHFDQVEQYVDIEVGGVILATGWKEYDPSKLHYGYKKYPNVITQMQLARMLDPLGPTGGKVVRPSDGKEAKRIVMVQCVGSRSAETGHKDGHSYCSRVCCMVALKHANLIKRYFTPDAQIYICYIDIRAYGKGYEEYYERAKQDGVKFIRGLPGEVRERKRDNNLLVYVDDSNTNQLLELDADLLVLSAATEPTAQEVAAKFTVSRDESDFIKEFHVKIRPTDTSIKNVFVAGAAQGPKDIPDSIAQAGSAAASAAGYLGSGYITLNPQISYVDSELCRACGRCEETCEFKAIKVNEDKLCAEVAETLCEGCGKCTVVCPTGAVSVHSFDNQQIMALIEGLLEEPEMEKV